MGKGFRTGTIFLLLAAPGAWGALGAAPDLPVRPVAALSAGGLPSYTIHAAVDAAGVSVSEYVNAQGQVFAVSWQGPFRPDLPALLGSHASHYQAMASRALPRGLNAPAQGQDGDLVIHAGGHPKAFFGYAYLASLLPAGFDPAVLLR
ncbi:Protein of unknown function [Andreprevotia lacus DSM 23236]|uniref:DUF2844 domain-containing protein n=1 Tax=Andreprevotia lacus DSM 23236 TaxID=1121001 RepID=A0A1W1XWM5_9NEIS|nr:DUF2844 domain-containing protein [Andreprevotia lacus]SMC28244.1 Protein of unknown function [Andreprevotia lacus DSM 23236]